MQEKGTPVPVPKYNGYLSKNKQSLRNVLGKVFKYYKFCLDFNI